MNSNSHETLRRIEQNDAQFTELQMGYSDNDGRFISSDDSDYSRLGAAIGNNNHLKMLFVTLDDDEEDVLDATNNEFFNGLKRNSSISDLLLDCRNQTLVGGVGHEILKSYQHNNNNLTYLCITDAVLENGGVNVITEILRCCTNLKCINFGANSITDEQLLPIVEAIKEGCNTSLENLHLYGNRIGNAGCHVLATLLRDPNTKLHYSSIFSNDINNEGATTIANSLANNTKLKRLDLRNNPFDPSAVDIFCTVLCNTSSVNDTHRSNHTLEELILFLSDEQQGQHEDILATVLDLNKGTNKSHVAIKKILKYHPNMEMEPLFEWDADGEQTLKALPYVIDWFKRAKEAVADEDMLADNEGEDDEDDTSVSDDYDCVYKRKLSAIFQFAKAMPLLLEPISCIKVDDHRNNKRKRVEK